MKKYTHAQIILTLAFLGFLGFAPIHASAATVYLDSSRSTVSVGDTVIVSVKINAEGAALNTVDGDVAIKTGGTNVAVKEFSLANSAFGLWPRTPSLSTDGQLISFAGGVPGGFNIEGATMFKIIFEAKKEGTTTLAPQNISVYANDGKGTKVPVKLKGLTLTVGPKKAGVAPTDEWTAVVAGDTTPPEDFIVVPGQESTLFDGKKFVFFSAIDNQSGISHYEVSENGAPAVRSGSMYVLQHQSGDVSLMVTAFDKAGNKKTATYKVTSSGVWGFSWTFIIIVIALVVIWYWRRRSARRRRLSY